MGGGKSSSSSESNTQTTTSTATATGVVGDLVQGQLITINEQLPDAAVDVFNQLVNLAGQALQQTSDVTEGAANLVSDAAKTAAQPDVALIQGYQKQVYYIVGAVALAVATIFIFRRK